MNRPAHPIVAARALATLAGAAALLSATACATTPDAAELEHLRRQAQSRYDLGVDHLLNGRIELALREFLAANELQPDDPRTLYAVGETLVLKGKVREGEASMRRALELSPSFHEARLNLSSLLVNLGRYEEAIAQCDILLDDPTFPFPWHALTNRGWANYKLSRLAEARRDLERARASNRGYWPMLLNLGILEAREGHRLEAATLFQKLLEQQPGARAEAEANYRLAEIYVSLGKRERAVGHLMAAVAQEPDGSWGRKSEEYLKLLR